MKSFKNISLGLCAAMGLGLSSCGTTGTQLLQGLGQVGTAVLTNGIASDNTTSALASAMATSGSSNTWANVGASVLGAVIQNYANGQAAKGTAQTYENGAFTAQLLVYNTSKKAYANTGTQVSTKATSTLTVSSSALALTIPTVTAGGATLSQTTITNLVATNGKYGLSENSTCTEGQLTYNGKTYDLANAYIELTYSGTTSLTYSASIYFNYDATSGQYLEAMNVTFKK